MQHTTDVIAKAAWQHLTKNWTILFLAPTLLCGVLAALFAASFILAANSEELGLAAVILTSVLSIVTSITYLNASAKWCEELHKKKKLKFKAGLKYGFSRFWGVLGTLILTIVKTILWTLLLILPGIYKSIMYMHSIQISQLEKISGGDANALSEAMIAKAGPLRTLGNFQAIQTVVTILVYVVMAIIIGISFASAIQYPLAGSLIGGLLGAATFGFMIAYLNTFINFQYLYYRDESKSLITKMKRQFKKMG
jgi:hypothetical protein